MIRTIKDLKKIQTKYKIFWNVISKDEIEGFIYDLKFHSFELPEKNKFIKEHLEAIIIESTEECILIKIDNITFKLISPNKTIFFYKEMIDTNLIYKFNYNRKNYKKNTTVIVGLGPHAKKIYLNNVVQDDLLIVDLESNSNNILHFLKEQNLKYHTFFVKEENKVLNSLESVVILDNTINKLGITKAIISTNSRNHEQYINYFSLKLIDSLIDKPLVSYTNHINSYHSNWKMVEYFHILSNYYKKYNDFVLTIQVQRRWHKGYLIVVDKIKSILNETKLKITDISLEYSDGKMNTFSEYLNDENHSYKYGFGKLMHSGYHFIDLISWLLSLNGKVNIGKIDSFYRSTSELNYFYKKFYKKYYNEESETVSQNSEEDIYVNLIAKNELVNTFATLKIESTGPDRYKGNGRIRHERLSIKIGHLLTIYINSFQSKEIHERKDEEHLIGGLEHFDIHIFQNSNLISGEQKPLTSITSKDIYKNNSDFKKQGHNELAIFKAIEEFYNGKSIHSDLLSHQNSIKLHAAIYNSLLNYKKHEEKKSYKSIIQTFKNVFKNDFWVQGSFLLWKQNEFFRKINDIDIVIPNLHPDEFYKKASILKNIRKISHSKKSDKIWYLKFMINGVEYSIDVSLIDYLDDSLIVDSFENLEFMSISPIVHIIGILNKMAIPFLTKGVLLGSNVYDLNFAIKRFYCLNQYDLLNDFPRKIKAHINNSLLLNKNSLLKEYIKYLLKNKDTTSKLLNNKLDDFFIKEGVYAEKYIDKFLKLIFNKFNIKYK